MADRWIALRPVGQQESVKVSRRMWEAARLTAGAEHLQFMFETGEISVPRSGSIDEELVDGSQMDAGALYGCKLQPTETIPDADENLVRLSPLQLPAIAWNSARRRCRLIAASAIMCPPANSF